MDPYTTLKGTSRDPLKEPLGIPRDPFKGTPEAPGRCGREGQEDHEAKPRLF